MRVSEGCLRAEQSAENDLHEILDSHDIQQFLPINTRIIATNPRFVKTIHDQMARMKEKYYSGRGLREIHAPL